MEAAGQEAPLETSGGGGGSSSPGLQTPGPKDCPLAAAMCEWEGTGAARFCLGRRRGRFTILLCGAHGSSQPGFLPRHAALPLAQSAAKEQERKPRPLWAGGGWEVCSGPERRPAGPELPRRSCGAEITGTGRAGWQVLPAAGPSCQQRAAPSPGRR